MHVVCSQPSKARKESKALASCIKCTGFEMFPCSSCERRNLKCVVSDKENSSRCSECVLCKVKCNVKGILVGKQRSLELETNRLKLEKENAFYAIRENIAQIERLEKQQKFLKSKGKDIVCCGLKTINKLEAAEEKEKQTELEQAA